MQIIAWMYRQHIPRCILRNCLKFGTITDQTTGEIVCESCGRVWEERTEVVESATYGIDLGAYRTANGITTSMIMYDRGLCTTIGKTARDWNGKSISHHAKMDFVKLRSLDSGCTYASHSLQGALVGLNTIATKLAIPDAVIERAAHICRKAMECKLAKGRNISSISCAALYAACREGGIPRTIDEIIQVANIPKKRILRAYKALINVLSIQPGNHNLVALLSKLANQLNVSEQTKRSALSMLAEIQNQMVGRNPSTIVATILYIACMRNTENKTQKYICDTAGICATTIRSTMNSFKMSSEDDSERF